MAIRVRLIMDTLTTFVCAVALILVAGDLGSPARPAAVLIGVVIGSGWALAGWIKLPADTAYVATITLAIGCAVPLAIGVLLVESDWWHPIGDVAVILGVAAFVNLVQFVRDTRKVAKA